MTQPPENLPAHHLLQRVTRAAGSTVSDADPSDLPEELRALLREIQDGFLRGTATTCRHSPDPASTRTALAAGWRPELIVCPDCAFLLDDGPAALRALTCNVCRAPITGDGPGRQPWSAAVQLGVLLVQLDLCGRCIPAVQPQPQPSTALQMRIRSRGRRGRGRGKGGKR